MTDCDWLADDPTAQMDGAERAAELVLLLLQVCSRVESVGGSARVGSSNPTRPDAWYFEDLLPDPTHGIFKTS